MSAVLRVAYVTPELSPYAKSGELADVAAALPKYLASLGVEVVVFLPYYRQPELESLEKEVIVSHLPVYLGERVVKGRVWRSTEGRFTLFLIDNPRYFWREKIYGSGKGDYLDNDERFIFFSKAVLETIKLMDKSVDIIHCNNWSTALVPVFLKTLYHRYKIFKRTATVLTLHNVAYQGMFPPESLALTGLNWKYLQSGLVSLNGHFNFLKAGIVYADMLNTVSSSYRRELWTQKHSHGLASILKTRRQELISIRNGIDYELWDPAHDKYIAWNYQPGDLEGKRRNKLDLIEEFQLDLPPNLPLLGTSFYLSERKGIDLLLEAMDELMKLDLGMAILGKGEEIFEQALLSMVKKYPRRLGVRFDWSPALIHKLVAGVDMFLIPSWSEPCGLNQLYGFRYGAVPIVRTVGGLQETVRHVDPQTGQGTGFVFQEHTSLALIRTVREAIRCYRRPSLWQKIVRQSAQLNFSWEIPAKKYLRLYYRALQRAGIQKRR
ncbi:MAG: hypothetical protein B5M54_01430 [Candidatus Aminicenantes bacterium 4484_214]|nr:MAG: hypothetical protein B5M54_01430 [Candidatus Aminicenantes bacterium 4484_214]RLE10303.1 MAG: glycogen synthase GlgA [Candidatus Aminicenantes bacterium]